MNKTNPETVVEWIRLKLIELDDRNFRADRKQFEKDAEARAASMRAVGQLEPCLVFSLSNGRYLLCDGHVRYAAAGLLKWSELWCQVRPMPDDPHQVHLIRGRTNLDAASLRPLDEHLLVTQLLEDFAGDVARVAAELGQKPAWVRERQYLGRLAKPARAMLAAGRINLGQAREICQLADAVEQMEVAAAIALEPELTGKVYPVEYVRDMVEQKRRALGSVPWVLDVAFGGRPMCQGCPNNTATPAQRELFGAPPAGTGECVDAGCFQEKTDKAAAACHQVVRKLEARKLPATRDNVTQVLPSTGLKVDAALRAAKSALPTAPAAAAPTSSRSDTQANTPATYTETEADVGDGGPSAAMTLDAAEHSVALDVWERSVRQALQDKAVLDPALMACLILLETIPHGSDLLIATDAMVGSYLSSTLGRKLRDLVYARDVRGLAEICCQGNVPDRPIVWRTPLAFVETMVAGLSVPVNPRPVPAASAESGRCKVCGCTEDRACPGGCSWIDKAKTLCSSCGNTATAALRPRKGARK